MTALREHTRRTADALALRTLEAGPPADLAETFVGPLAATVIAELLGVPAADIEVGGVTIREGEAVYVFYPAANRDPSVYTEPDRLDLDRNEAPYLAFGHGAHYCAGAQLARMEAEVMLSTLLTRFPELATAVEPERIARRRGTVNRGPVSLPVTW
ncbi:cytochrome P450 [Streptomyces sp. NPDC033754]|uniref:cytochrome P450 n=1 Tax=unclassified Streptomyces TaxID=2593676 RepID=UPI0033E012AB